MRLVRAIKAAQLSAARATFHHRRTLSCSNGPRGHLYGHHYRSTGCYSRPFTSQSTTSTPAPAASAPPSATAAATAEGSTKEQEEYKPGQEVAFPWRPAPRAHYGFFELLSKTLHEFMPQAYIRSLFFNAVGNLMECPQEDLPDALMRTTRFAFIQAVRSIFEGECQTPPPTWEYTADEDKISEEHKLGYPALIDIMDAKLVELYEHVTQRFRANKRQVRLELQSIIPVSIDDLKLIIGPPRGVTLPGITKHERLGVTVIAKPVAEDPVDWGSSFLKQIRPHLVQDYHYLFQIAVTFKCKELFVVTNEETDEIVQGIDEYVETEHLVRFEIDFDKNARLAKDWQIIDVDDFLGGNPYLPEMGNGSSTEEGAARGEGGEGRGRGKDE